MKACPGLRSGIDRSGSLSFAIRGIPSPIRPHIRHSGEGRNPEGWGEGNVALGLVSSLGRAAHSPRVHRPASHHFHPLMRPSQGHGDSGDRRHAPYPDTGPESRRGGATLSYIKEQRLYRAAPCGRPERLPHTGNPRAAASVPNFVTTRIGQARRARYYSTTSYP